MNVAADIKAKPFYIHATALIVDAKGIIIRGPSRAGKSSLALELLQLAPHSARLIGDDRVSLERVEGDGGSIVLRGHPLILGRIEKRGQGILDVGYVASGVARLVLDLQTEQDSGGPSFGHVTLCGLHLPACTLPWNMDRVGFVLDRLAGLPRCAKGSRLPGRVSDKFGAIDFH